MPTTKYLHTTIDRHMSLGLTILPQTVSSSPFFLFRAPNIVAFVGCVCASTRNDLERWLWHFVGTRREKDFRFSSFARSFVRSFVQLIAILLRLFSIPLRHLVPVRFFPLPFQWYSDLIVKMKRREFYTCLYGLRKPSVQSPVRVRIIIIIFRFLSTDIIVILF